MAIARVSPVSSAISAMRRGAAGSAMATRNGWPGAGWPELAMSPAAFTIAPVMHGAVRAASACWAAQPFTYPVGSTPPGMAQGSNQPRDSSRAAAQRSRTPATSAGACVTWISPARRRLIGLPGCQVLKTSSACWRAAQARASWRRTSAASPAARSRPA